MSTNLFTFNNFAWKKKLPVSISWLEFNLKWREQKHRKHSKQQEKATASTIAVENRNDGNDGDGHTKNAFWRLIKRHSHVSKRVTMKYFFFSCCRYGIVCVCHHHHHHRVVKHIVPHYKLPCARLFHSFWKHLINNIINSEACNTWWHGDQTHKVLY